MEDALLMAATLGSVESRTSQYISPVEAASAVAHAVMSDLLQQLDAAAAEADADADAAAAADADTDTDAAEAAEGDAVAATAPAEEITASTENGKTAAESGAFPYSTGAARETHISRVAVADTTSPGVSQLQYDSSGGRLSAVPDGCFQQRRAAMMETVCGVLLRALLHPHLFYYAELLKHPLVHSLFLKATCDNANNTAPAPSPTTSYAAHVDNRVPPAANRYSIRGAAISSDHNTADIPSSDSPAAAATADHRKIDNIRASAEQVGTVAPAQSSSTSSWVTPAYKSNSHSSRAPPADYIQSSGGLAAGNIHSRPGTDNVCNGVAAADKSDTRTAAAVAAAGGSRIESISNSSPHIGAESSSTKSPLSKKRGFSDAIAAASSSSFAATACAAAAAPLHSCTAAASATSSFMRPYSDSSSNAVYFFLQLHALVRLFSTGTVRDFCRLRCKQLQQLQKRQQQQHRSSTSPTYASENLVLLPALHPVLQRKLRMQTILRRASNQRRVSLSSLCGALSFYDNFAAPSSRTRCPTPSRHRDTVDGSIQIAQSKSSGSSSNNNSSLSKGCHMDIDASLEGERSTFCTNHSNTRSSNSSSSCCSTSSRFAEAEAFFKAAVAAAAAEVAEYYPLQSLEEEVLPHVHASAARNTNQSLTALPAEATSSYDVEMAASPPTEDSNVVRAAPTERVVGAAANFQQTEKTGFSLAETEMLVLACMQGGWLEGRLEVRVRSSDSRGPRRVLWVKHVAACDNKQEDLLTATVVLESLEARTLAALQVLDHRIAIVGREIHSGTRSNSSSSNSSSNSSSSSRAPQTAKTGPNSNTHSGCGERDGGAETTRATDTTAAAAATPAT